MPRTTESYAPKRKVQRRKKATSSRPSSHVHRAPARMQAAVAAPAPVEKPRGASDVGGDIGKWVGSKLGDLVGKITGFGDYELKGNSIMDGGMSPPQVQNTLDRGGYIIRHREYICDINATTTFTNQIFDVNAGISTTFPWLAGVAQNFEEYAFRGLIFEFRSLSSDAVLSSSTSSALGSVIMATQYNPLNPTFTDKKSMENYEFACSAKPSESFIHPVECKRSWTPVAELYVRTGLQTVTTGDQRLYDLGAFQIATVGCQAATGVLGELWASFEVELYKPKFATNAYTTHIQLGGILNSTPLGTAQVLSPSACGSNLGGVINGAGTAYSFPPNLSNGSYFVYYQVIGTSGTITAPGLTFTNCAGVGLFNADTYAVSQHTTTSSSGTIFQQACVVQITAQGAAITWSTGGGLPSSATSGDLWIMQIASSITN